MSPKPGPILNTKQEIELQRVGGAFMTILDAARHTSIATATIDDPQPLAPAVLLLAIREDVAAPRLEIIRRLIGSPLFSPFENSLDRKPGPPSPGT